MNAVLEQPKTTCGFDRGLISLADFLKRCEAGEFLERRVMLLAGEVVEMPNANPPHDAGMSLTQRILNRIFDESYLIRNQQTFPIGDHSDPEPDFAVVHGEPDDYGTEFPTTALLVVEVSNTSFAIDRKRKADLYAEAKVPEYWIVDLKRRQLLVFRDPVADANSPTGMRYSSLTTHDETDTVAALTKPDKPFQVAAMLPKVK
jgi:Uma2 family endonuclease